MNGVQGDDDGCDVDNIYTSSSDNGTTTTANNNKNDGNGGGDDSDNDTLVTLTNEPVTDEPVTDEPVTDEPTSLDILCDAMNLSPISMYWIPSLSLAGECMCVVVCMCVV